MLLEGRSGLDEKAYLAKIADVQTQKDRLEIDLSRRSSGLQQTPATLTVESLRELIPPDAALVEFVNYLPIEEKAPVAKPLDSRLVAYVIRRTGTPEAVTLGNTKDIEFLISNYRSST